MCIVFLIPFCIGLWNVKNVLISSSCSLSKIRRLEQKRLRRWITEKLQIQESHPHTLKKFTSIWTVILLVRRRLRRHYQLQFTTITRESTIIFQLARKQTSFLVILQLIQTQIDIYPVTGQNHTFSVNESKKNPPGDKFNECQNPSKKKTIGSLDLIET